MVVVDKFVTLTSRWIYSKGCYESVLVRDLLLLANTQFLSSCLDLQFSRMSFYIPCVLVLLTGAPGIKGAAGVPGTPGYDGQPGVKGDPGRPGSRGGPGQAGSPGVPGRPGQDGRTGGRG